MRPREELNKQTAQDIYKDELWKIIRHGKFQNWLLRRMLRAALANPAKKILKTQKSKKSSAEKSKLWWNPKRAKTLISL